MRSLLTVLVSALLLLSLPLPLRAESVLRVPADGEPVVEETAAEEDEDLELVVTASRRVSPKRDAPAMVTVLYEDELDAAPGSTVDDVLRLVPGLTYSRTRAAECGPGRDITIRGIPDQKRSLVLIDGLPLNDGVTGAVNWSYVPRQAIERIEIVRGPMSALYGSGAMGGVINVITHTPEQPNETFLEGGYGSLNTYTATIVQGGMFEHIGYQVSGNLYKSDGYVQVKDPLAYHTKAWREEMSVMGKVFLTIDDDNKLTLSVNHVAEAFSRGLVTDKQANSVTGLALAYDGQPHEDVHLSLSVYAQRLDREVDLGARPNYDAHDHTEFDLSWKIGQLFQANIEVGGFSTVSVGVDTAYKTLDRRHDYALVEREAEAKGNQLFASLFAQDELRFVSGAHRFLVTPGVRVDFSRAADGKSLDTAPGAYDPVDEHFDDRSWTAVNPKLSLVYQFADWTTVRASAGRSFAAPTLFELYTVFTRGPMLMYGNPELDPERAWSAELGVDQWITKGLLARMTGYYTRGADFIGYRTIEGMERQIDNITDVQIAGVDFELRFDIHRMVTVYGGYTFNWSEVVEDRNDATIEGNELPFQPWHRARLGVIFEYERWIRVDLNATYEGERYVDLANTKDTKLDAHVLLSASLAGDIIGGLRWGLTFENLLDDRYDVYSVPTELSEAPGLRIDGRLSYTF